MPTIPDLKSLFDLVTQLATLGAIVGIAIWKFNAWRRSAEAEENKVDSEAKHRADHAKQAEDCAVLRRDMDSLQDTVVRLTSIVEKLNATVGELNTARAVLADREGSRVEDLGPRPRKRR